MEKLIKLSDAVKAVCKGCLKENPHCRHHWDCPMLTNLGKLPSADRPKGEWIEQEDDYHHYWERSECGMGVGLDDVRNFCPNCGADMRGSAAANRSAWIPCSERMPHIYGRYLVTTKIFDNNVVETNVWDDEEQRWCWVGEVIAWMPLPEPWKGADDE